MGRCQSRGSLKPSLLRAPHLSGARILFLHPELPFLRAHLRECLQSAGCWRADTLLLPDFPEGSLAHAGELQLLMTLTSLFTDTAGNSPFLPP